MITAKFFEKIQKYKLDYLALFVLVGAYFTKIQWNNYIGDPDGFYHTKIAQFLSQGIVIKSLPWMKFSTLANNFTDHHFLYHILLAPFTYLGFDLCFVQQKILAKYYIGFYICLAIWRLAD